ncbi:hypothetical protein FBU31_007999, partial [Coemansia sp. 'formosensis']
MMQTLSLFQLLPPHAVRMVVNHLVGNIRLLSSGVTPDTIEHKMMLVPLLWICRNFRAEAAAIFYKVNAQDI